MCVCVCVRERERERESQLTPRRATQVAVKGRKAGLLLFEVLASKAVVSTADLLPALHKRAAHATGDTSSTRGPSRCFPDPSSTGSESVDYAADLEAPSLLARLLEKPPVFRFPPLLEVPPTGADRCIAAICAQHNAAMQCYLDGRFEQAVAYLACVQTIRPDDVCASYLIDRCRTLVQTPPDMVTWNGLEVMTSKSGV